MMKLGIIGGGVVGHALARSYLEWTDVWVYDVIPERRTHTLAKTLEGDVVFVCLPTPQCKGELRCDLSYLETFLSDQQGNDTQFVLRSTVPIGTTKRLAKQYHLPHLVHSPESLTARCALTDAQLPARNLIGLTGNGFSAPQLRRLYKERFPTTPVYNFSSDETEAVKLFVNGFFSVKVAYFNEINALCDKLGLDWDSVLQGVLSDGRILPSHTRVPGPDSMYGFGGTCLPKDLANLVHEMIAAGLDPAVTQSAYTRNKVDRQRQ